MDTSQLVAIIKASGQHKNLYHFTDRRNLALMRHLGGILSMKNLRQRNIAVPAPGGNQWSLDADEHFGMDRFVHLCFTDSHPMEYLARQDGRIVDTAWLKIRPEVLNLPGVKVTSDVSNKSGVIPMSLPVGINSLDLEVIYNRTDWRNSEVQARLRAAEKCEVLVPDILPLAYVENIDG